MSRKLIIAMAILSFAFAGTTFAAVENIKVSGDTTVQAVTRNLSLGSEAIDTADAEDFVLSQIRLKFDADLTEGISAVIRILNERVWGSEDIHADETSFALDLGYVELKEFFYDPLTLIVGRQNLRYGSGLIVGDPDTNRIVATTSTGNVAFADLSMRKSFDAVRGILDFAPYTIDLVYAKVDENTTNLDDDITLLGVNVAYDWGSYNGITEGYFFSVNGRNITVDAEEEDSTWTVGARTQFDPNDNLTLGLEGAYQGGDVAADDPGNKRDAWAGIANAEYKFLNDYNTKVGLQFTYLSGDDDADDAVVKEWDVLFEDQMPGEILNLLPNSNLQLLTVTTSMMPREDLTLGLLYTHARLAEKLNSASWTTLGVAGPSVAGNKYTTNTNKKTVGNEIDVYAVYDYTEDVQLKLNGAWFMPGKVFAEANDNSAYSVRGGLVVNF